MSECGVCIGSNDYGCAEWSDIKILKCRKPHKCCECKREIPKGATYERAAMKYDGDFYCYRTCMDCVNIRDGLRCNRGFLFETLWESIEEVFGEITTGCLQKIETASAKAYLMERWRKWKGLEELPPGPSPANTSGH
jgi:hypothetical protein